MIYFNYLLKSTEISNEFVQTNFLEQRDIRILEIIFLNSFNPNTHLKVSDVIAEASGYIPKNDAEAADDRWLLAMTKDIKPGEDVRQAAKLGFTLKNGRPPTMRTDGKIRQ